MSHFPESAVTVTLTGEEWTTIIARLTFAGHDETKALSAYGRTVYRVAARKLAEQVGDASRTIANGVKAKPRLVETGGR